MEVNEMNLAELDALLRSYYFAFFLYGFTFLNPRTEFTYAPYIEVLTTYLERCSRGCHRRLIFLLPPRSLKSLLVSVCFSAWLMGRNPSEKIICACYGQELADKLAMDCRMIMNSPWYQRVFPQTRLSTQGLSGLVTSHNGSRIATSVGGALTGMGANFIFVDDAIKPGDSLSDVKRNNANEWFRNTLYSRQDDPQGSSIVVVMQRVHEDDLVGRLLESDSWEVVRFPAIAEEDEAHIIETPYGNRRFERKAGEALNPGRESVEALMDRRRVCGEYIWASQYQQHPAPLGGGLTKSEWFRTYNPLETPIFEYIFQCWDTANKESDSNDYSVCTTWGIYQGKIFLMGVLRERMEFPKLKRAIVDHAQLFNARYILIEDKASGTALIQDLIHDGVRGVTAYTPKMKKYDRMLGVTPWIENGFVYTPEKAPWLAEYLHELTTFPSSKFDDQVDATSAALEWAISRIRRPHITEYYRRVNEERDAKKGGK
jgi:predicted phage terminase large subunit-like protein